MKVNFKVFITIFILSISNAFAVLHYEVTVGIIGSGHLSVSKIHHGTNDYTLVIYGDVKIPFRRIIYNTKVHIKNKTLHFSEVSKTINGTVREKTLISKDENNYIIEKESKTTSKFNHSVDFTVAMLYLSEPTSRSQIFSEKFAVFCPLTPLPENKYELQLPDGIKTVYHYAFGICTYVKTRYMGQTLEFKLK